MNSAGPRGGNLEAQLTPEAAVTAKELAEMLITRRLSAAVFIAAIAGCGGSGDPLLGTSMGPGGGGGGDATAGAAGAGGTAGASTLARGGAGGAVGHVGTAGAGGGGRGGAAAAPAGGTSGLAGAGGSGGHGGAGGAASAPGGAGGAAIPDKNGCGQDLIDYASLNRGGVPVTCVLDESGICECTQDGSQVTPNLWCVYLHNEPVPNVLYCTIPGYPLDPCGPDLVAWASKTDGGKTVACTYTSGRCLCGPPGGPPEVQCEVSHAELADVKGSIFCGGI